MKYVLLIYHDEQSWAGLTESERQQIYLEYRQLIQELQSKGKYLAGEQLQPAKSGGGGIRTWVQHSAGRDRRMTGD